MNYGKLNKRISLYLTTSERTDATGNISLIYTVKTVWANVKQMSATRVDESSKVVNATQYKVTFRYDTSIRTEIGEFVIYYGTKPLTPHTIENVDEDDDYIIVMCSDGGNYQN